MKLTKNLEKKSRIKLIRPKKLYKLILVQSKKVFLPQKKKNKFNKNKTDCLKSKYKNNTSQ